MFQQDVNVYFQPDQLVATVIISPVVIETAVLGAVEPDGSGTTAFLKNYQTLLFKRTSLDAPASAQCRVTGEEFIPPPKAEDIKVIDGPASVELPNDPLPEDMQPKAEEPAKGVFYEVDKPDDSDRYNGLVEDDVKDDSNGS